MAIPFILLTSFINLITAFSLFLFMLIKAEVISIGHALEAHRNRMRGGISGMQPVNPAGFMDSLDPFKGRKSNLLQAHAVGDRSLGLPCSISIRRGIHRSYWGSMLQALRVSFPIDSLKRCCVVLFLGYVRPFGFRRGM